MFALTAKLKRPRWRNYKSLIPLFPDSLNDKIEIARNAPLRAVSCVAGNMGKWLERQSGFNPSWLKNVLKPAAGQVICQRDGFPTGGTPGFLAGRCFCQRDGKNFQRDGDFFQRGGKIFSRTAKKLSRASRSALFQEFLVRSNYFCG